MVAVSFRNACALDAASNGPSTIQYAWMWYQLPYGIVAAALSVALFTELADYASKEDTKQFKKMFVSGTRLTLFLITPFSLILIVLADPLISLYHAGEFSEENISQVAEVLFWWGTTLPLYSLYMYLYMVFAALKDLVTLTTIYVLLRVVNIGCYMVLTSGIGSFEGFGLKGIPLADTVFYLLMNFALLYMLQRKIGNFIDKNLVIYILKITGAALGGGIVAYILMQTLFVGSHGILASLGIVVFCACLLLGSYSLLAKLFRISEVGMIEKLFARFKRKPANSRD